MGYSVDQLDQHFDTYRKSSAYDDLMRMYTFRTFEPFLNRADDILEFGCSDGQMTEKIARHANVLDVVDGSLKFIELAKKRGISNARYHHSLFEKFVPERKYDVVFATYVLTHVPDIAGFFSVIRDSLKENGYLLIAVPNSRVLSRQLALHMGLLEDLFLLSENDRNHGHCRCFDRVRLSKEVESNGFEIVAQGGIILKPLADFQMDRLLEMGILKNEQMEGLYRLGLEYPDLSAALFCVCRIKR